TRQIKEMIDDPDFDPTAEGSRRQNDGFRALATYREFEAVLLPRLTRAAADSRKRSRKLRNLYEKLSDEEEKRPGREKRRSMSVEQVGPASWWPQNPLELPAVLFGRLLIFAQDRAEKGFWANVPLLVAVVAVLTLFVVLFGWQMGWIG